MLYVRASSPNAPVIISENTGTIEMQGLDQFELRCTRRGVDNIEVLRDIITGAFGDEARTYNIEEDLSCEKMTQELVEDYFDMGIVAVSKDSGTPIGVNFLSERDQDSYDNDEETDVRMVGPIGVLANQQGKGVGKRLMQHFVDRFIRDESVKGKKSIRLMANTHNPVSVSVYISMGYEIKRTLTELRGHPRNLDDCPPSDENVRFKVMELSDAGRVCDFYKRMIGYRRMEHVLFSIERNSKTISSFTPYVMERRKSSNDPFEIVAITTGFHIDANVIADGLDNLKMLLLHSFRESNQPTAEKITDPAFGPYLFADGAAYPELLKWLIGQGFKIIKHMHMMCIGEYRPITSPSCIYCPSVSGF
eukprot:TRINITY_DN5948_c0_g2_i1.p1 TRINITY_DN5948_c0_g2~~TRINITY_DN5948_c0_g2_i1.p1  ORF type:complete len:363 (-),score=32.91 TRINITY_DN5948_c0_g2_i1:43-1131(-)